MNASPITTHVLDTALGKPAVGVPVQLLQNGKVLAQAATDENGRVLSLMNGPIAPGTYELRFDTAAYAAATGGEMFYPHVSITFRIEKANEHFHLPLILSPFGYTTYRGSR